MAPVIHQLPAPPAQQYGLTPSPTGFPAQKPNEFFSLCVGDVLSMLARTPSAFLRWLPAVPSTEFVRTVAHLSWLKPTGLDGSESYMDHILGNAAVGECDFGTGGMDFQTCEYVQRAYRITKSNKNNPLNMFSAGGIQYCQNQPRLVVRGENAGIMIDNDRDWVTSTLLYDFMNHLEWNAWYGDPSTGNTDPGMYEGLDSIITTGWVASRSTGEGSCDWTDPLIINGVPLDTVDKFVRKLRYAIRLQMNRMIVRGFMPSPDDMVIVMPRVALNLVWDHIATGILSMKVVSGIEWEMTPEIWQRERERMTKGGIGYGFIPFDGHEFPVIPEDQLGRNRQSITPKDAVTFDAYVLVKNFNGIPILIHEYLNLAAATGLPPGVGNDRAFFQNGMIMGTWDEVRNCYYLGIEMYGRITSLMNVLQTKITDVTLEIEDEYPNIEAASFTHENYYAYEGQAAWAGTPLLTPLLP